MRERANLMKLNHDVANAIAQWIRLHLPSAVPGSNPLAYHLRFFGQILPLSWEEDENKTKEAGFGPYFKKANASFSVVILSKILSKLNLLVLWGLVTLGKYIT